MMIYKLVIYSKCFFSLALKNRWFVESLIYIGASFHILGPKYISECLNKVNLLLGIRSECWFQV